MIVPRCSLSGTQYTMSPSRTLAQELKDKVKVSYVKYASWNSGTALANFDKLLEGKQWDLIHFNYGLNDIMHKDRLSKIIL